VTDEKTMSQKYRVEPGQKVRLSQWDPSDTGGCEGKAMALKEMKKNLKRLAELEYLLYAENKRSVLIVLQAMDAGERMERSVHVMGR
jgi:polyphosphate kinase 2 (PPK2 family)